MQISNTIYEIIKSVDFKNRLEKINNNYPNLKQENVIRNTILEHFNDFYANEHVRAFAEHPRVNNTRVDLSIVNKYCFCTPYKIELKFIIRNMINVLQIMVNEFKKSLLTEVVICSS